MLFGRRETEVLIAGAGPVGMFTALSLAERGVACEIVDERERPAAWSYAVALHPGSLELLDGYGVGEELARYGRRVDTIAFYEGADRRAELELSKVGGLFSYLLVVSQTTLERKLEERLKTAGVEVKWNHRVSRVEPGDSEVSATVQRRGKVSSGYATAKTEWEIEKTWRRDVKFVVGADGHESMVRRSLGIELEPRSPSELIAIFDFDSNADFGREVRIVVKEGTASVAWLLPDGRCRWNFGLEDATGLEETRVKSRLPVQSLREGYGPHLRGDLLKRLIAERAPWFRGTIGDVEWSLAVRFERCLAERFGQGRVWLAGDAAHLTSPIGVQSMNVGLREGHELGRRMTTVLREGAPLDVLEQYGVDRRAEWQQLLNDGRSLDTDPDADPWLRENAGRLLSWLPDSGEHMRALLTAHGVRFP